VLKDRRVGHAEGTKQEGERNEERWKSDKAAQACVDGDVHLGNKWGHSNRLGIALSLRKYSRYSKSSSCLVKKVIEWVHVKEIREQNQVIINWTESRSDQALDNLSSYVPFIPK